MVVNKIFSLVSAWWLLTSLLLSSLLLNACQAVILVILPFTGIDSFSSYKQRLSMSQSIANTWWQLFCFLCECWSGIQYRWTGDRIQSNDNAILIGNHERGIGMLFLSLSLCVCVSIQC